MGVFYETIPSSLNKWILNQKLFWVATAPLSGRGHVNVSPKAGAPFGLVGDRTFWYAELTGSGSETLAHLHEPGNGRITVMLNAFEGAPKIVRLWGNGRVLEFGSEEFKAFANENNVELLAGTRSIIIVDIHQVGSSCGFGVPYFDFKGYRSTLVDHFCAKEKKYKAGNEKENIERYWALKNSWSMDGLPAMRRGVEVSKQEKIEPTKKMVGPLAPKNHQRTGGDSLSYEMVVVIALVSFLLGILLALYGQSINSLGSSKTLAFPLTSRSSFSFGPLLRLTA